LLQLFNSIEDSDLICFGCPTVLYKLRLTGNAMIFRQENFKKRFLGEIDFVYFQQMCVLSGCLYAPPDESTPLYDPSAIKNFTTNFHSRPYFMESLTEEIDKVNPDY